MTHFLQRSALIFLATSALCASPALARPAHHARKPPPVAAPADADTASYKVRPGDTLAKIADKLDTTVDQLMAANKLSETSILRPGQTLKNPAAPKLGGSGKGGSGKAAKAAEPKTYTVVHGDTLFSISKRLGVTVDDLRQANGLSGKAQIHAGQELKLPGGDEPEVAPAKKGRKGKAAAEEAPPPSSANGNAGKVVTTQAKGESYKARAGDTLAKIADRLGTDVGTLKRLNHVKGKAVRVGQVYRGPSFAEHAYTAVSGDTIAGIAQRFGVSVASLRAENEWSKRVVSVRPGQKVYLPDGYRDRSEGEEHPLRSYLRPGETSRGEPTLPSQPQPYSPSGQPRPYIPGPSSQNPTAVTPAPTPAPTDAQVIQLSKGRFQWPIRGDIISDFGPKAGGQRNDGVNIQAETGAPVRAAADGDVVYAGDQVPGFGNLVLIKHADGWATAYSHLARIDVKAQQKITQGQQIGQAGNTGGVSEPQLHFEVRYGAHAVDPKLVLPPK